MGGSTTGAMMPGSCDVSINVLYLDVYFFVLWNLVQYVRRDLTTVFATRTPILYNISPSPIRWRHLVASLHQVLVSLCNWSIFARLVSWKDVPVFVLWCNPSHVVLLWRYMPLRGRAKCCSFKIDSEVCIVRKIFLLDLVISHLFLRVGLGIH